MNWCWPLLRLSKGLEFTIHNFLHHSYWTNKTADGFPTWLHETRFLGLMMVNEPFRLTLTEFHPKFKNTLTAKKKTRHIEIFKCYDSSVFFSQKNSPTTKFFFLCPTLKHTHRYTNRGHHVSDYTLCRMGQFEGSFESKGSVSCKKKKQN